MNYIRYNENNMHGKKITDTVNFDDVSIVDFEKEHGISLEVFNLSNDTSWKEKLVTHDIIGYMHKEVKCDFSFSPEPETELCIVFTENELHKELKTMIEERKVAMRYSGIIEVYPQKFMVSIVLEKFLLELQSRGYKLVKIHNGLIRAFA